MAVRGWDRYSATPFGDYQAPCGHYIKAGTYACEACNITPLTLALKTEGRIRRLATGSPTRAELIRELRDIIKMAEEERYSRVEA